MTTDVLLERLVADPQVLAGKPVVRGTRRLGFEVKYTDAPRVTPSMRSALEVLRLDSLDVIHAGRTTFALGERLRAVALERVLEDVQPLG